MEIYPATAAEKAFSYHHELPPEDLGLIGHLRGDFGYSGKEFWPTFFDAVPALKTQAVNPPMTFVTILNQPMIHS